MRKTTTTGATALIAALALVGCAGEPPEDDTPTETVTETAQPSAEPSDSAEPTESEEPEGQWAEPVEVDASLDVETDPDLPATVRWTSAGETLRIYVSGSGTLSCVPVPIDAWTDGTQVEVEFEPADTTATCTADLRMHAWEVTWGEPFTVDGDLPLFLTSVETQGEQLETKLPADPLTP